MDRLDLEKINSLEHPLIARMYGGDRWPVHDIDVETGLIRIDVCGKLQTKNFTEVSHLYEANNKPHVAHKFYVDA